ncbi:MAG: L,D-transpeptidase [Propionibacteriaceae bacterium]|jgi:hypothetical protein|nr:L,D-transpeptidase [Propionibacteriaceae bacterium]
MPRLLARSGLAAALTVVLAVLTGLGAAPADAKGPALGGSGNEFFLNDGFTGAANITFEYGTASDTVFFGDWDGDGIDTPMIRRGNQYLIRNSNTSGGADVVFNYGDSGDTVLTGDWNGDGIDTLMVRRGNHYFVSNTNGTGTSDYDYYYGNSDDVVLVGDWNGDGVDTLSVRRGGAYHVNNSNGTGVADYVFWYGNWDDTVLVGDWNGDGVDTLGVVRGNHFFLRNSTTTGVADIDFYYGNSTDLSFAGDWNGDRVDSIGVRRPPAQAAAPTGEKWIDINLTTQTLTAYQGSTVFLGPTLVSTGTAANPTYTGTYRTYLKYDLQTMRGTYGVQPDVPWVMYFNGGQAIHGAYWHNNFGHVMSHGCVNMRVSEAKDLYYWAPIGTKVVVHY